ncbi:MAG: gamma-glutamylputrescine oxidase [Halieaceae bacterium]|jgi:gamma-glutamylputrescine oxidase
MYRKIESYYAASANQSQSWPKLLGEITSDVCIIGGGYTGLSTALHLQKRGYSTTILEAEHVAWGASGRNGGHVGTGQRAGQDVLEEKLGLEHATQLWEMGLEAVSTVTDLIEEHNIACDLKTGNLHVASKSDHVAGYRTEVEHLQQQYGYDQVRYIERDELESMTSSRRFFGGMLDEGCRHLHPLNYALGLARAATELGCEIYENSRVTSYTGGETITVATESGQVKSKFLVLACNGYLGKLEPRTAGKIMPINNFMLATEPLSEDLARSLIRDDTSVSDSLFVIDYWKLSGDNRMLFGGGENYSSRFPADIKGMVRKCMLKIYPELEHTKIDYAWGGTLAVTMNRLPHFGQLEGNILFAQGYSGHGVPTATMAGKLIAEAVAGTAERFDVMSSIPTHTFPGGTLLRWPGLVAGMLYYSLRDHL